MPSADKDGDGIVSYEEMQAMKLGRSKAPDAGAKEANHGSSAPGGAKDTNKLTPRPDGPPPTEQQINMGPYAGRHTGGWKMKDALLAPDSDDMGLVKSADGNGDRLISMSNVHGTWFSQSTLKKRWYEKHNEAHDTKPAETIHERLYPLDRQTDVNDGDEEGLSYSPWEPTTEDMTPMSKSIGEYAKGRPTGPKKAAIQRQPKPPNNPPRPKGTVKPVGKGVALSDNPAWGNPSGRNWGCESLVKPDPAMGYTGHEYARRFDEGEEDLSMASRIARRRMQSVERRFGASPYAHEIAMSVQKMGDGIDYTGPKNYGWSTFPPEGLRADGKGPYDDTSVNTRAAGLYG